MLNMGKTMIWRDVRYEVVGSVGDGGVQLRCLNTGAIRAENAHDLLDAYVRDELRFGIDLERKQRLSATEQATLRLEQMSQCARNESKRRVHYILFILNKGGFEPGASRALVDKLIGEAAQEIGDSRPPHICSVYRWQKKHALCSDLRSLFSRVFQRGGQDASRLDPVTERLLNESIEEALSRSRRWSAEEIRLRLIHRLEDENKTRIPAERLAPPSLRTIQRRLEKLPAFDIDVARYGFEEAMRRHRYKGASRRATRILEAVEIDHTPVDVLIVDKHGRVLPRPVITVVFDRFSRCVLGYHISLDGSGTKSVFEALRHALFPKSYLKEKFGGELEWPCYGWFELLLADNGTEFHSASLEDALINLGIGLEFARSRAPDDKPFVERFLRTLNYAFVHRLPGTTLEKHHKRVGFKSEDEAALTLEELDRLIHVWICRSYHLRPQAGLNGRAPQSVWADSAKAFPPQLKCDARDVEIEFSQTARRELQHYGIDLNTFKYSSPELSDLRRLLPSKAKVDIKWPWSNVGHIYVWNPLDKHYIRVPNNQEEFVGLTLDQASAVKDHRSSSDSDTDVVRADAQSLCDDIVDAALSRKGSRKRSRGARLAGMNSAKHRQVREKQKPTDRKTPDLFQDSDLDDDGFEMEVRS